MEDVVNNIKLIAAYVAIGIDIDTYRGQSRASRKALMLDKPEGELDLIKSGNFLSSTEVTYFCSGHSLDWKIWLYGHRYFYKRKV